MTDDIATRPEQEMDFVEYLRLWASVDPNDQAVRDLHKAADEIERLLAELERWKTCEMVTESVCDWDSEKTHCDVCKRVKNGF